MRTPDPDLLASVRNYLAGTATLRELVERLDDWESSTGRDTPSDPIADELWMLLDLVQSGDLDELDFAGQHLALEPLRDPVTHFARFHTSSPLLPDE